MSSFGANSRFLAACRREPVDRTPVWFMRQAGRYMKEFREIRKKHPLLTVCKTPELATEVTLQPVDRLGVDAAILFADILLPLEPMGIDLEFAQGEGPVIHNPVREKGDVDRLRVIEPAEKLPFVGEAIRQVRSALAGRIPLIGFAGAPFTLASYLIEGGHSRNYLRTKQMMYAVPEIWHALMRKLSTVVMEYLKFQVRMGAQAVQLFDSWVGALSPNDYETYVIPHVKGIFDGLKEEGAPAIHFGTGTGSLLEKMREAGGEVIGVDWRVNLDEAWSRIGYDRAIQGNLDPAVLLGPIPEIERRVADVLRRAGGRSGHIFNLGHGIFPETPVEHVAAVVEMVHNFKPTNGRS
jgi:uroporphyrinogen decarboxylase